MQTRWSQTHRFRRKQKFSRNQSNACCWVVKSMGSRREKESTNSDSGCLKMPSLFWLFPKIDYSNQNLKSLGIPNFWTIIFSTSYSSKESPQCPDGMHSCSDILEVSSQISISANKRVTIISLPVHIQVLPYEILTKSVDPHEIK